MKTALVLGVSLLAIVATACGSDSQTQQSFGKGTAYNPTTPSGFQATPYAVGPYGTGVGSTIANQEFLGWHAPTDVGFDTTKLEKLSLAEYYNPNGDKPIKAIWLNSAAVWCSACKAEYNGDIGVCDDGKYTGCECNENAAVADHCSVNQTYCGGKQCVRKTMAQHGVDMLAKGVPGDRHAVRGRREPAGPGDPERPGQLVE